MGIKRALSKCESGGWLTRYHNILNCIIPFVNVVSFCQLLVLLELVELGSRIIAHSDLYPL